jgi:hypothetical protein
MTRIAMPVGALLLVLTLTSAASAEVSYGNGPFRIEWNVLSPGQIAGRIYNTYHDGATAIRLLVQGLDATGAVVSSSYVWVGGELGGLDDRSFRLEKVPPAPRYNVTVHSFQIQERPGCCGVR